VAMEIGTSYYRRMMDAFLKHQNISISDFLRKRWEDELFYYSDERINQELKKCMIYNYSVEYDGRYKCIEKIAEYNSKNNYKVC
jgi:hypothetical protein